MSCIYKYKGKDYTKDEFYSLVRTTMVQPRTVQKYEKVLFPTGNTASKVEGHTTLEEFKKQKEDRIKELEQIKNRRKKSLDEFNNGKRTREEIEGKEGYFIKIEKSNGGSWSVYVENKIEEDIAIQEELSNLNSFYNEPDNEINQLKQELERVEIEGFGALKPIYNFYENTVTNILKKQGYNPALITDEYGNTWNEISINQVRDLSNILLQRNEANQIIGQANIKALSILIDAAYKNKPDLIAHEYAHHYIAWFRNHPLVQEAIKKWGSEENLVQAIGEQSVKQKGEAWTWWKKFFNFLQDLIGNLSSKDKNELRNILTDAFLSRTDLENGSILSNERINQLVNKVSDEVFNQRSNNLTESDSVSEILSELQSFFNGLTEQEKLTINSKTLEEFEHNFSIRKSIDTTLTEDQYIKELEECSLGKGLKAEQGLSTSFTRGGNKQKNF